MERDKEDRTSWQAQFTLDQRRTHVHTRGLTLDYVRNLALYLNMRTYSLPDSRRSSSEVSELARQGDCGRMTLSDFHSEEGREPGRNPARHQGHGIQE